MTKRLKVLGVTNQVKVTNFSDGRDWYVKLLGRDPDFMGADNFHEWEIVPGSWLQVAEGNPQTGNGPIRFGVTDIKKERERVMQDLNIEVSEIEAIDGIAAWVNFNDPFGNKLGLYQDLAESNVI
jgi:hypothetical protein